jgi:hypothetical protein
MDKRKFFENLNPNPHGFENIGKNKNKNDL